MKEEFVELLKKIEKKSGDTCASIQFFSDRSGNVIVCDYEIFIFESEEEFVEKTNEYLKEK